ncbi:fibronectin type III domain-containing protein [Nonomuraea endophytica]|uniref:fibronectin type III domain-containing protein n=1 Tax=Nonomuraea endophytica TaxID=714136 RepID=UPI0037CA1614
MRVRILRGDRATAVIAAVVAGCLVVVAAVFGVGVSSANPKLADVGAWLWTKVRGKIVHVNGLSGEADGYLDDKAGRPLRIVQDGQTVLLVDDRTGVVSRIEPSQLSVAQSRDFGAAGMQLVVTGKAAYAVNPKGTVQRIDPATLNSLGAPLELQGPLGAARIDGGGKLWVPVPAKGEVVPVAAGVAEQAVKAGEPGEELAVTIAGGLPVIVNTRASTAVVIGSDGGAGEILLPKGVAQSAKGGALTPPTTEGSLVPILAPGPDGLLVVIDTASNAVQTTKLESDEPAALGVPQVLGSKVYVPDSASGGLIVWDSAAGGRPTTIQVAEQPGPIEMFVKDGLLWANDENGDKAVVVDPEGRKHPVDKDDSDVPGPTNTPKPKQTPKPEPTASGRQPDPTRTSDPEPTETEEPEPTHKPSKKPTEEPEETPTPTRTPTPTPTRTPTPTPTPSPPTKPGSVSAKSGPGKIDITFSPSTGGKPDRYTVQVNGGDGRVSPQSVDANGPFQFEFSGGDCSKEYTFTVVAHWKGGEVPSAPSAGVKPCVAPGAPSNFAAKAKNRGADLSWSAPSNAGEGTTYELSGAKSDSSISGTSFSADGLENNKKYEFKLKAKNAAGESQEVASATADLAYPRQAYRNTNNNQVDTLVRPGPSKSGEAGRIAKGQYISITVICQVKGASVTEDETKETSDVWNRIEWNGGVAYLSVTLMDSPRGAFPAAPLFECTD